LWVNGLIVILFTALIDDFDGSFEFKDGMTPISILTGLRSHRANNKIVSVPLCLIFDSIVSNPSKSLLNFRSAANEVIPLN
jgi:hypothetical protein